MNRFQNARITLGLGKKLIMITNWNPDDIMIRATKLIIYVFDRKKNQIAQ